MVTIVKCTWLRMWMNFESYTSSVQLSDLAIKLSYTSELALR